MSARDYARGSVEEGPLPTEAEHQAEVERVRQVDADAAAARARRGECGSGIY